MYETAPIWLNAMRITYLHQYFTSPAEAGGTRSYEMARRLVTWGHQVNLVTSRRGSSNSQANWTLENCAGIKVHTVAVPYSNAMSYPARIKAFVQFAWLAARRAATLPCDVVFATSTPLTIALPGVYAARRQHVPMVFEVRDLWPEVPIALGALKAPLLIWAAHWLEKFAYRNSAQIVALSPGMQAGIVQLGYPAGRVNVIPNGADLDLFDVPQAARQEFRCRFEWLGDRPLIVYTGALGKVNGVDYLAQVACVMRELAPEVRFLILGEGREKQHVCQAAQQLGVLNQNFLMLDSVPKRDIPVVLAACDIAASVVIDVPALWNNSANKFFDALAAGRPVAINHLGWQADLLREKTAGLVLDPRDYRLAAERLRDALHDPEWLQSAGQRARQLAVERFDRENLARQLELILSSVVTGSTAE